MLTDEELEPGAEDLLLGEKLVTEGWIQISAKYRTLLRWRVPPPRAGAMLTPEILDSPWAKLAIEILDRHFGGEFSRRTAPRELLEECTLTVKQFEAFKRARRAHGGW